MNVERKMIKEKDKGKRFYFSDWSQQNSPEQSGNLITFFAEKE